MPDEPLAPYASSEPEASAPEPSNLPRILAIIFPSVVLLLALALFGARSWAHHAMQASLPQIDGTLTVPGLSAHVLVQRDSHGIPHIEATSVDDLVVAQGYVTAQDRLWQMDTMRRHGAGELAEVLGSKLLPHDRVQRLLEFRATADRVVTTLPPDQLHFLELYAMGVNESMAAQQGHLPLEFRLLHYKPAPWTPRDSILVGLVMFQDLTNTFPTKLSREFISTRLPPALLADLYPVGSWRDHPPSQAPTDLTTPQTVAPDVPLDESQSRMDAPRKLRERWPGTGEMLAFAKMIRPFTADGGCEGCRSGSNDWVVAGSRTASGKPLLSNDMHLNHTVPGIWYEADLKVRDSNQAGAPFHVTGVSLPGTPFVIVGHNDHVAWGFTNLGADVQDVYVERTRGTGENAEYQSEDGNWHAIQHAREVIHVRGARDIVMDEAYTLHNNTPTPIISGLFPAAGADRSATVTDRRALALRWTIYEPGSVNAPFYKIDSAVDGATLRDAFSDFGGPSQNMVYADDQGHIGYHAVGRIPLRGNMLHPSPLSPVPVSGIDPAYDWAGYIPYDQLPQVADPAGGLLATANARITPEDYPYPITLDWTDPYRNERIWKVLSAAHNLKPADMLTLQTDVYSDGDHAIAQRLAYAIDHADPHTSSDPKRLHQAADLLRSWDGRVETNSAAAAITDAARAALWPMLLLPRLGEGWQLYTWGERAYAEEQLIMHNPARWLPGKGSNWNDLLAAAVDKGLAAAHAPADLSRWQYGEGHVLDIEHPVFSLSPLLHSIVDVKTGAGPLPQSGDGTTVKQVGRSFGPSERFTADLGDLDNSTLNVVLGESGDPISPWFMDQFPAWYQGTTFTLPFSDAAVRKASVHSLTLTPR